MRESSGSMLANRMQRSASRAIVRVLLLIAALVMVIAGPIALQLAQEQSVGRDHLMALETISMRLDFLGVDLQEVSRRLPLIVVADPARLAGWMNLYRSHIALIANNFETLYAASADSSTHLAKLAERFGVLVCLLLLARFTMAVIEENCRKWAADSLQADACAFSHDSEAGKAIGGVTLRRKKTRRSMSGGRRKMSARD